MSSSLRLLSSLGFCASYGQPLFQAPLRSFSDRQPPAFDSQPFHLGVTSAWERVPGFVTGILSAGCRRTPRDPFAGTLDTDRPHGTQKQASGGWVRGCTSVCCRAPRLPARGAPAPNAAALKNSMDLPHRARGPGGARPVNRVSGAVVTGGGEGSTRVHSSPQVGRHHRHPPPDPPRTHPQGGAGPWPRIHHQQRAAAVVHAGQRGDR